MIILVSHEITLSLETIRIQHDESGSCLEPVSGVVKATGCDLEKSNQLFQMIPSGIHKGNALHFAV